jgi:hypothetical protein
MVRGIVNKLVLAAGCVLVLGAAVEAAVLSTPVLLVDTGRFMSCLISNLSDRDTTVRIEVIGYSGATLADSGEITLPAGQSDGQSGYDHARCRFTVSNKAAVRAHATVYQSGVGSTSSVEAR